MLIPGSEALAHEGVMVIGLLLALVALWVTSALSLGVTALIIVVLGLLVLWIVGNWVPVLNATVNCSRCGRIRTRRRGMLA